MPRLELGTKRKAEVLSKESGKIGVTITTSSTANDTPPPAKVFVTNQVENNSANNAFRYRRCLQNIILYNPQKCT